MPGEARVFDAVLTFRRPDWAYGSNYTRSALVSIVSKIIDGFDSLAELALNLRWSWNHASDGVWRQLDSELWELTHNPWVVLQTVSRDKIKQLLADPAFRKNLDGVLQARRQGIAEPAWFQKTHPNTSLKCAAYFSMEFMLSEALPFTRAGLGM